MIGQWIYVFFRRGHPQLCNRQTILVSLKSTGSYQRNGASLIFMRCVVLEMQLFFRLRMGLVTGNEISEVHELRTIVDILIVSSTPMFQGRMKHSRYAEY